MTNIVVVGPGGRTQTNVQEGGPQATVRLQTLDGAWETVGVDRMRGIYPEGISLSSNTWGSDTARFMLKRDANVQWPDLSAFTPCEVEVGGVKVWTGRVYETPSSVDGISVEGRGWQYHLDDDVLRRGYVHQNMSDWQDSRSFSAANLLLLPPSGQVDMQDGAFTFGLNETSYFTQNSRYGVTFDSGIAGSIKGVIVQYTTISNGSGGGSALASGTMGFYGVASDSADATAAGDVLFTSYTNGTNVIAVGTTATPRRYLHLHLKWEPAISGNPAAGVSTLAKVSAAVVFSPKGSVALNTSALKASQVISDLVTGSPSPIPLLSTDTSGITATTFIVPEYWMNASATPREVISAMNAFHGYKTQVDIDRRLLFQPLPSAPIFEAGDWDGFAFSDTSANSGENIYDRAVVEGQDVDGTAISVTRTNTAATYPSRRGFHRTKILTVDSVINTATANQLGDIFLQNNATTPFSGTAIATEGGVRRVGTGQSVHPAELLTAPNELLRQNHMVNPDTGALGRDGRIAAVTYDHDAQTAQITIDDQRSNFAALLARLGAVSSIAVR